MLGSTVKKNTMMPEEQLLTFANETFEDQQTLKKAIEDQNSSRHLTLGPGHYDPKQTAIIKKSPSVSFGKQGALDTGKDNLYEMAEIVIGRGNMAERVNAAREKIKNYLGSG